MVDRSIEELSCLDNHRLVTASSKVCFTRCCVFRYVHTYKSRVAVEKSSLFFPDEVLKSSIFAQNKLAHTTYVDGSRNQWTGQMQL